MTSVCVRVTSCGFIRVTSLCCFRVTSSVLILLISLSSYEISFSSITASFCIFVTSSTLVTSSWRSSSSSSAAMVMMEVESVEIEKKAFGQNEADEEKKEIAWSVC